MLRGEDAGPGGLEAEDELMQEKVQRPSGSSGICPSAGPGRAQREGGVRGRASAAPEGKGQWSQIDPGLKSQAGISWGLGPLCPRIKGPAPGWAWLLEWASDSTTMGTKPSPLGAKAKVCWWPG